MQLLIQHFSLDLRTRELTKGCTVIRMLKIIIASSTQQTSNVKLFPVSGAIRVSKRLKVAKGR